MSPVRFKSILALTILLVPIPVCTADDWVMGYHDSRHTGQSSEVVTPPLTLAWTWADTNAYDNSTQFHPAQHYWLPIYYQGRLCFQGGKNANRLFCVNPANGSALWEYDNPGYANNGYYLYQFDNYPAAVNGRILNASTDFSASMDAATGGDWKLSYNTNGAFPGGGVAVWNNLGYMQFLRSDDNTEGFYIAQDPSQLTFTGNYYGPDSINMWMYGIVMPTPAVDNGVVYVNLLGTLNAMDARTGQLLWTYGKNSYTSSPAVSNGVVYFFDASLGKMVALDAAHVNYNYVSGVQAPILWTSGYLYKASSPIVSDGAVYVGSADGGFYALDAATGATKWRFETGSGFGPLQIPAISGDLVYVPCLNKALYALDKRTGAQVWRYNGTSAWGPVVISGGMVFTSNLQMTLYAFRPQSAAVGPAVTAVSPARVSNGQAAAVSITGTGFYAGGSASAVQGILLDGPAGVQLGGYTVSSDQSISVSIPAGTPPGIYHLRVTTSVRQSANEPSIEVAASNSVFPAVLGQSWGSISGTAGQLQRHLVRTSNGNLIAVYAGVPNADKGGGQNAQYNISHDGGLTWTNQAMLHAAPWSNYTAVWAPTSSLWADAQDHVNISYVQWNSNGQSFEKYALNGLDFLIADPGYPVSFATGTSSFNGTTGGQACGRRWTVFLAGTQVIPRYSDDGGMTWTVLPAVNVAAASSPSLVMYKDQPAIFYNEGNSLAWVLWNGQHFGAPQVLPGPISGVSAFSSAVTSDGQLHLAYAGRTGGVSYTRYSGVAWSAPLVLDAAGASPSLTTNGNNLWCFYANASGDIVYRRTSGGQWKPAAAVTADGNYNTAPSTLALSPGSTVPVIWTSGPSTGYTVKSAVIAGDIPPVDVSSQVNITQGPVTRSKVSSQMITVTNTGSSAITGPIEVVLTNLSAGVTIANSPGTMNGNPYLLVASGPLATGASVNFQIQFTGSSTVAFTYTPVTYSGAM